MSIRGGHELLLNLDANKVDELIFGRLSGPT